jgi:ferredoxin
MKVNLFKLIRIIIAIAVFIPVLLFFCDFTTVLPKSFSNLLRIQLVPAILSGSMLIVLFLSILTLLFGRIYCSVICPLGILQDVIARLTRGGKKKNKKKRRYAYSKPFNILRYSLLTLCAGFLLFGMIEPLLLLDPYSNFGRIAANMFRPVILEGNNLINWIALKFNNYDFYHITIYTITALSFSIATIVFLVIGIMSFLRGRLFCNTICPVGSLLGLISRFSIFRIVMDESGCTGCKLCERSCKSQCINSKNKKVDSSRCVVCFNCLSKCKTNAINYRFAWRKQSAVVAPKLADTATVHFEKEIGISRRSFLVTSTAIAATVPVLPAWAQAKKELDVSKLTPITPPGSKSLKHFKDRCTACYLCVAHCPSQVLRPAGFNFGIDYAFKPHMVCFEGHFCDYECLVCSEVCPNGAIGKLSAEEKKITQIGIAQFTLERCVVYNDRTSCGACAEHCPVKAVRMEPYIGALTLPHVYPDLCIGCGGCESICPVKPIKAITIWANEEHKTAEKPKEEKGVEFNNEFGF